MILALAAAFACQVVRVHDGDTLTCADRTRIRVAGVDANEMNGTCHHICAAMSADRARAFVSRLTLRRTLTCDPLGMSYRRVVARCALPDGRDLSCVEVAAGAAVVWRVYWRRYGMGSCP